MVLQIFSLFSFKRELKVCLKKKDINYTFLSFVPQVNYVESWKWGRDKQQD